MIGIMLEHDFMIKQSICDTFVLTKRGFSGSDQMPLNTLSVGVAHKRPWKDGSVFTAIRPSA